MHFLKTPACCISLGNTCNEDLTSFTGSGAEIPATNSVRDIFEVLRETGSTSIHFVKLYSIVRLKAAVLSFSRKVHEQNTSRTGAREGRGGEDGQKWTFVSINADPPIVSGSCLSSLLFFFFFLFSFSFFFFFFFGGGGGGGGGGEGL